MIYFITTNDKYLNFSHRHRRTEEEEDAELISQNKTSQTSVLHFDKSPHCMSIMKPQGTQLAKLLIVSILGNHMLKHCSIL